MTRCAVLTDSTSDLSPSLAERLGVHVIPLNVHFDGQDWLDNGELSPQRMFTRVAAGAGIPSTSPPEYDVYHAKIEELLQTHDHVLAVHISSKFSAVVEQAQKVAAELPGRLTVVDSLNSASALAMQAERAVHLLGEGLPPEQVKQVLEALRPMVRTHMCLDTLTYLHKNGRIGGAVALIGGMVNLKPILGVKEGQVEAVGRTLGNQRALRKMSELLTHYAEGTPAGRVAFFFNGSQSAVDELKELAQRLSLQNPFNLELGMVLSTHGGPDVYGFSFEPATIWHEYRPYVM